MIVKKFYKPRTIVFHNNLLCIPDIGMAYCFYNNNIKQISLKINKTVFLGYSHTKDPIYFNCLKCSHIGYSNTILVKSYTQLILALLTCACSLFSNIGSSIYHSCPICKTKVAYSLLIY